MDLDELAALNMFLVFKIDPLYLRDFTDHLIVNEGKQED